LKPDQVPALAYKLAIVGDTLCLIFILLVVFASFPFRITNPLWLAVATESLLSNGGFALVGLSFLSFASYLDPDNIFLQKHTNFLFRLCCFAVVGFSLLIPIQFYISYRNIQSARDQFISRFNASLSQVKFFEQKVRSAKTFDQLQVVMRSYQAVAIPEAERQKPLDSLKSNLLIKIQEAKRLLANSKRPELLAEKTWEQVQLSVRNILWSLVYVVSFSAFAQRRDAEKPWLQGFIESILNLLNSGLERRERRLEARVKQAATLDSSQASFTPKDISRQHQEGLIDPLWLPDSDQESEQAPWTSPDVQANADASLPGSGLSQSSTGMPTTKTKWWQRLQPSRVRQSDEMSQFFDSLANQASPDQDEPISSREDLSSSVAQGDSADVLPIKPPTPPQPLPSRRGWGWQRPADVQYFEALAQDDDTNSLPDQPTPKPSEHSNAGDHPNP
jgi:hypothetical protein